MDVAQARRIVAGGRAEPNTGLALARLHDSIHTDLALRALDTVGEKAACRDAALALTRASAADGQETSDEGLHWLVVAQSLVNPGELALAARIVFRLGLLHIRRGELAVARTVAEWGAEFLGPSASDSTDLLQLEALLADALGNRTTAERLYRRAVARSAAALTPLSRVIALHDLAETLSHSQPRESISLYGLALALIDANQLARGSHAAVTNGMGYAQLCAGDVVSARARFRAAGDEARACRRSRIELYAQFNEAIAAELEAAPSHAEGLLRDLLERANAAAPEIRTWAALRLVWLALERGERSAVATALGSTELRQLQPPYVDTVQTLRALAHAEAGGREAIGELGELVSRYRTRGDDLTAFVLELWLAWCQRATGMTAAARRTFATACEWGGRAGFTVSPNWWSIRLIDLARTMPTEENAAYVASWWSISRGAPTREHTIVVAGDAIIVDGLPLASGAWRRGKTGSGVLHRYLGALVAAHPAGLDRDELADVLWPESDGDKAVRNLYWATRDLRDTLAGIEGLRVDVHERRYRLGAGPNVLFR